MADDNVVALFDTRDEARAAEDDLIRAGFDRQSIRLVSQDAAVGSARSEAGTTDKSLWDEIKDFFRGDTYDDRAEYEEGIRRGGVLLSVKAPEPRVTEAISVLMKHNPVDLDQRAGQWRAQGWTGAACATTSGKTTSTSTAAANANAASAKATSAATTAKAAAPAGGEQVIPVVEEQLEVGKRQVQRGVRIYQHVTARPVEKQVQLKDERVTVERRAVDRPATVAAATGEAFQEKSYKVTETHEEPVVQKTARVVEEVVVNKEANVHTETVRDQVRRTDVEVQQAAGNTADEARTIYDKDFATSGVTYDQWKPAYDLGCTLAADQQYRGRDWRTVEPDAKRNFERSLPGRKWDQFRDAVHRAYDRTRSKV